MLAAGVFREVDSQKDSDGLNFARKTIVISVLTLSFNSVREVKQLRPPLQRTAAMHMVVLVASSVTVLNSRGPYGLYFADPRN